MFVGGISVVFSHSVSWMWWGRVVFECSSLWLCVIYILHIYDLHFIFYILHLFCRSALKFWPPRLLHQTWMPVAQSWLGFLTISQLNPSFFPPDFFLITDFDCTKLKYVFLSIHLICLDSTVSEFSDAFNALNNAWWSVTIIHVLLDDL